MSHRQGLHSDDSPYPGEPLCYCDEKTPTTSTPTDLDKLKDDIAVEVSIVFKHAKLGTSDPVAQIVWMQNYVNNRYGSWANAVAHSNSVGWY